jgi:beta-lactamase regulating signal transducer with metallopeptidase domain
MTAAAIPASTTLLVQIGDPAARALLLAAAAGLGLAAFRVRTTSTRLFTWTAVLYAALAMPFLGWMLPPLQIPTPQFLQNAVKNAGASRGGKTAADEPQTGEKLSLGHTQGPVSAAVGASKLSLASDAQPINTTLVAPAHSAFSPASIPWSIVAAGIYLAVAFLFLVRFIVGLEFGRRLTRASRTIDDPRVTRKLASRAQAAGLAFTPRAAESELISVPVTMGALRSMILLPSSWREWDDAKLDAVVAHEVSHVARRDALTQRLSLLHRAIFWFSPLAWWLDRRLADLAEQASDEAVLSCGADRKHYARILLGFFEALHAAPGRVWWQGVSMAKAGQAEQRVERILSWKGSVAMRLKKSIAVVVVALAVPVVYLAASAHPAQHVGLSSAQQSQDRTPPPAPNSANAPKTQPTVPPAPASADALEATPPPEPTPESEPAIAPAAIHGTINGGVSGIPVPSVAPVGGIPAGVVAPAVPVGPAYPPAPVVAWSGGRSRTSRSSSGRGYSYAYGYDDEQRFVIVTGKSDSLTMSGSAEDARHVEKLRKTIPGDFIWFERDEKSYVIRDQATIDRARKFWAPQEELGKKQEALGKKQEILGKQQEALGAKMEQIHVTVPDMSAELDKLKAELKQLSSSATMEQVGHIQSEIGELQSKIGDLQSHAGEQQGKLGEEMGALGEKQGKLGEQQGELGRQQAELAEEASRQMKQLLDEAIKKGTAQPEL